MEEVKRMMPEMGEDTEEEKVKERELLLKKALLYGDCVGAYDTTARGIMLYP